MVRWIKPGLVALYNISSGNGAGLFLQPLSPHGAIAGIRKRIWWKSVKWNSNKKTVSHPALDHLAVCCW